MDAGAREGRLSDIDHAASALNAGALVILPTETVYGLAADAANPAAVLRLYEAKGRPRFNPLIAHVSEAALARRIGVFTLMADRLAEAFWPGPLTLVTPVRDPALVCDVARSGLETVAIRVPAHPRALDVLGAFGRAAVAPSANRSGRPSPTRYADALEETGAAAAAAIDGGDCEVGVESSVVSVSGNDVRLLRVGGLSREQIEAVAGPLTPAAPEDARRSPGRLARHYAPAAPIRLDAREPADGEILIGFGDIEDDPAFNLSRTGDLREAAANLFAYLRAADRLRPKGIAVAPIPGRGLGEAINDRLSRAAGFVG